MLFHSGNYYAIILNIYNKYRRVLNEYECLKTKEISFYGEKRDDFRKEAEA